MDVKKNIWINTNALGLTQTHLPRAWMAVLKKKFALKDQVLDV